MPCSSHCDYSHFNSRPHGGRRAPHGRLKKPAIEISTHALTEGDSCFFSKIFFEIYFNSRPHGGRRLSRNSPIVLVYFNSRPHGGRRFFKREINARFQFQLTPSRRATSGCGLKYVLFIFQLTPSRRATKKVAVTFDRFTFQLTPSRRATGHLCHGLQRHGISTHALTEGDNIRPLTDKVIVISTHALTEGDIIVLVTIMTVLNFNSPPHRGPRTVLCYCFHSFSFQLTPSRRATNHRRYGSSLEKISTHALTEGDGKFRQIFLLNRGYAYSISLYFLPHFISLLPQILSFQQKSFKFQVRIFLLFSVHLAFALQNQCVHHVKSRFCTNMFYFVFVLFTQIVKPQTIGLFIYDFF